MITLTDRGPNTPAMQICAKLANRGDYVPIETMDVILAQIAVEASIVSLSDSLSTLLAAKFEGRDILSSWELLLEYLKAKLVPLNVEEVRVLFLNAKNHLLADEVHHRGTVDECPVHIREIIHRALNLGATAMILAHNHPSGDPSPSAQDIRITDDLLKACRPLKITIHDHVIIGGNQPPVSMRAKGLLS